MERNPDIDPVCPYCGALNLPVPAGTVVECDFCECTFTADPGVEPPPPQKSLWEIWGKKEE